MTLRRSSVFEERCVHTLTFMHLQMIWRNRHWVSQWVIFCPRFLVFVRGASLMLSDWSQRCDGPSAGTCLCSSWSVAACCMAAQRQRVHHFTHTHTHTVIPHRFGLWDAASSSGCWTSPLYCRVAPLKRWCGVELQEMDGRSNSGTFELEKSREVVTPFLLGLPHLRAMCAQRLYEHCSSGSIQNLAFDRETVM